jgi:hypothetical protein
MEENNKLLEELRGIQRIVINTCYGGFGLSESAWLRYCQLSGQDRSEIVTYYEIPRDDPYLVQVVRELGSDANTDTSQLKIVEVPASVKWHVAEYDGMEWVAEDHRTWN